MKEIILFTFISSFTLSFLSPKKVDFRPPGTMKVVDNFYIDQSEVSNRYWHEYLSGLKEKYGERSAIYKQALPDTNVWTVDNKSNLPFAETYFRHPSYQDYPVVGISYDQAKAFCDWRTEAVKEMMQRTGMAPVNFAYRLPTQTEWELIANAGYTSKQEKSLRKANKKYDGKARTCNMKFGQTRKGYYSPAMLAPVRTYLPNKYKVFNIYGNVAEMVAEPKVAMGGSFLHYYDDIVPTNATLTYDGPQSWLGFRSVCEIY